MFARASSVMTPDRLRWVVGSLALSLGCGLWLVDRAGAASAARPVAVELQGEVLGAGAEGQVADLVDRYLKGRLELRVGERRWGVSRADLGVNVDRARLEAWLGQGARANAVARQGTGQAPAPVRVPLDAVLDPAKALPWLGTVASQINVSPQDASYDASTRRVRQERVGHRLDVWASVDAIARALDEGRDTIELPVVDAHPARTAAQLAAVDVSATLGEFSTHYSMLEEAADRTHNLRLIAQKIDGTVLLPGEEFDFNRLVGERNRAAGFRPAPTIAGGELVDGLGGGACQVAGTLHAAAFFAGLPIVERSPHSRPSAYIRMGLDAAVAFPKINFRFRNDRSYPLVISMKLESGQVRAQLLAPAATEIISFVRRIESFKAYAERIEETSTLPKGVRVLTQRGVAGFTVTRWRIRRDPVRNQAVREAFEQDVYPPTTQIWKVGTGPAAEPDFTPPEGDKHPEYTADRYLVVTQGAGLDEAQVTRIQGPTGTSGWTAREGMPGVDKPTKPTK